MLAVVLTQKEFLVLVFVLVICTFHVYINPYMLHHVYDCVVSKKDFWVSLCSM